ncbi:MULTISPECIES: hypothetical protein [Lactobacillaceae]|uniref:hypothetical protein n=1 Tax=Lactobacillaceae TaxID=33958 RepID=UPI0039E7F718
MKQLNSYIDHTLLKPESTQTDVDHVVQEAIDNHFYSVMINCQGQFKNVGFRQKEM